MSQKNVFYSFSGYRYAPESFRAYKRFCGGDWVQIPLSHDQRSSVGYLYLTKGMKAAVDFVKRHERELAQKYRTYVSYGFRTLEDPRCYLYVPQLYCRADAALSEKAEILRELRQVLLEMGGRLEISSKCELDGLYRPINVVKNYSTADFSRPVLVHLRAA